MVYSVQILILLLTHERHTGQIRGDEVNICLGIYATHPVLVFVVARCMLEVIFIYKLH